MAISPASKPVPAGEWADQESSTPGPDSLPDQTDPSLEIDSGHPTVAEINHFTKHDLPWDRFTRRGHRVMHLVKPSLVANNPDLDELSGQVWKQLKDLNDPPFVFRQGSRLCRIEVSDTGHPIIASVDAKRMQFFLVSLFEWIKEAEEGTKNCRPPRDLVHHLVADPDPPVPDLQRIVTAPIFARDGRLLDTPCDYSDGILYLPPRSVRLPNLPEYPTDDDVRSASNFLIENLLIDFGLATESDTANCLAAMLTPFVRELIDGPTPLCWIDKSQGGSGGTLLSNVISMPFLGTPPSGVTAPNDEAEWNRLILSTLLRSPNVFFIDNCNDYLSSAALAHAITAARYEGRIIGSSHNEAADVRCLWIVNGNNLHFGWELARRAVRIRIAPNVASPDQRDSREFKHPKLLPWILEHRTEVLYHLLLLIKAWQVRGCPGPATGTPEFASFESWRAVLGGILNAAGIPGFLLNLKEARRESDQESADVRLFIEAWHAEFGTKSVYTTDLLPIARGFFELPQDDRAASIRLGKSLGKYEKQIHGKWSIARLSQSYGKTKWRLQEAPAP
jgi:hypothetical protein